MKNNRGAVLFYTLMILMLTSIFYLANLEVFERQWSTLRDIQYGYQAQMMAEMAYYEAKSEREEEMAAKREEEEKKASEASSQKEKEESLQSSREVEKENEKEGEDQESQVEGSNEGEEMVEERKEEESESRESSEDETDNREAFPSEKREKEERENSDSEVTEMAESHSVAISHSPAETVASGPLEGDYHFNLGTVKLQEDQGRTLCLVYLNENQETYQIMMD